MSGPDRPTDGPAGKVQPMPDRIWVEAGREMCDDGSHKIEALEVVAGPDATPDYPYQETAEYVRARALAGTAPADPTNVQLRAALKVWDESTKGGTYNVGTVMWACLRAALAVAAPAAPAPQRTADEWEGIVYPILNRIQLAAPKDSAFYRVALTSISKPLCAALAAVADPPRIAAIERVLERWLWQVPMSPGTRRIIAEECLTAAREDL